MVEDSEVPEGGILREVDSGSVKFWASVTFEDTSTPTVKVVYDHDFNRQTIEIELEYEEETNSFATVTSLTELAGREVNFDLIAFNEELEDGHDFDLSFE